VIQICYIDGKSATVISAWTGKEERREIGDPAAAAVLNEILASVRLLGTPTPSAETPDLVPTATPVSSSGIRPPDTGDAGIR
jgi:hypothetical protein